MRFYDEYRPSDATIDAFVAEAQLGRLVTASPDGVPHIGLYPFWIGQGTLELHLHREDEQLLDLTANPRCVFEVDEVLAVIPSYWVHPENAVMATAYHRSVVLDCTATTSDDPEALAAQQRRIMDRYQPEGGYRAVDASDPMYRGMLGLLVGVRLEVEQRRAKFKLGQNRTPEVRADVARELRERGRSHDGRAADALQWTLDEPEG